MARASTGFPTPLVALHPGQEPLHRQLYTGLRRAILAGTLPARTRLPSTRALAAELGISRNTVELAFSQLDAEGLLERRVGHGSRVALPEHSRPPLAPGPTPRRKPAAFPASAAARRLAALSLPDQPRSLRPLTPCMPALAEFPLALWRRSLQRQTRQLGARLLPYGEEAGFRPLREAVAGYLGVSRGVRCRWEQVLIVSSTQQALDLVARVLLDAGDRVWLEEPGYLGARAAFALAGATPIPVPVDGHGLRVDEGRARAPRARLAYVTPSYQYPLGATLSLERRLALLEWARAAQAWVVEDDYDSEYRYTSRPLPALQGLDEAGCVLYLGTFNKVMFPALRLAYLVVPEALVELFVSAKAAADGHTPPLAQAAMADFIECGHFAAHLRNTRLMYGERRAALLDALQRSAGDRLRTTGSVEAGMHLTVTWDGRTQDRSVVERAAARGLDPRALSSLYLGPASAQGLVLGFSGTAPAGLRAAAATLAALL